MFHTIQKSKQKFGKKIIKNIIEKTFLGFKKESFTYRGILFFGLIIKNNEPYVIEYNVRFGDPECQTLLRKLNTDFLEIITSNSGRLIKESFIFSEVKKEPILLLILENQAQGKKNYF